MNGFRLILGRDVENPAIIEEHRRIPTLDEFRRTLLRSEEFAGKYRALFPENYAHPSLSMDRETVVFIHLQKTGGTSLRTMLEMHFPADRRCPVRDDKLHLLSAAELGSYDLFSGHFDRSCLTLIPRRRIKTLALFREPQARLISFYRFLRSHPTRDEFATDHLIQLANELSADDFFARHEARTHFAISNHYLTALGGSYAWFGGARGSPNEEALSEALEEAKRQVRALTALGITERFTESVKYIWKALALQGAPRVAAVHVTDNLPAQDNRFQQVPAVPLTPRLAEVLADLVAYDNEIYGFARLEFERRLAER